MKKRAVPMKSLIVAALTIASVGMSVAAEKKPKSTGTIKDLESRTIQIDRDPPTNVQPQQAIEQYKQFLDLQSDNEKMRSEAMRRLGDLQVEVDEAARAAGGADFAGLENKEAIKLYESLLAKYPKYERNDAVMYQLSRAYESEGQPEKSLAVLDKLVTQYPNSKWITEAQFRRGEILFSAQRYKDSERAYAAVVAAGPESGYYDQGLYKHGWSLFKQSRGEESVNSFLKLIDRVMIDDGKLRDRDALDRPSRELSDDAFRAVAITFYDLDGPESLDAFLKQRGDPVYAHLLYENLGNLYIEKERYQDAALAYEAFAKASPGRSFCTVTADAHHRGVSEGWLRVARARRQAVLRRTLRIRLCLLGESNGAGRA